MPKRRVEKVRLKDVFNNWEDFKGQKKGLVLVVFEDSRVRIERVRDARDLGAKEKIFLGEIKKPTLRVGFLNALFQNKRSRGEIDFENLGGVLIPVPPRLKVEKIDEYFKTSEDLKGKVSKLDYLIELKLFKEGV